MPNTINPAYRDKLVLVSAEQVGPLSRLASPAGAQHPMLRDDWQMADAVRGVLGRYRVVYNGSQGLQPWNYAAALNNLPTLESLSQGAYDFGSHELLAQGQPALGRLYLQLNGVNASTNIVVDYHMDTGSNGEKYLNLVHGDIERHAWNSYSDRAPATSNFLANVTQMSSAVNLWVGMTGHDWLYDTTCGFSLASADKKTRQAAGYNLDVEPVYNYYTSTTPPYENVVGYGPTDARPEPVNPLIKEYHLPNVYFLQAELNNTSSVPLALYHLDALTLNRSIPWFEIGNTQTVGSLTATENDGNRYYDMYAEGLQAMLGSEALYQSVDDNLQLTNRNFVVLHSDLGAVKEDSINTTTIPFYNKIVLGEDPDNTTGNESSISILQALYNDPDTRDFIDILQMTTVQRLYTMESADLNWTEISYMASRKRVLSSTDSGDFVWDSSVTPYKELYDFEWLRGAFDQLNYDTMIAGLLNANVARDGVSPSLLASVAAQPYKLIRDYKLSVDQLLVDPESTFAAEVDMYHTASSTARLSHVVRSYEEILHGTSAHTETLMYIVRKKTSPDGDPVQTFYISPEFRTDIPTVYYDTQVKYDTNYYYEVDKVVLVFGTKYRYAEITEVIDQNPGDGGAAPKAKIKVESEPCIKALVIPYTTGTEGIQSIIVDKPPVPPEINFYPYKGINNKLKILLNSSTGRQSSLPVVINDGDEGYFLEEYRTQTGDFSSTFQDFIDANTKLSFRSDDPVDAYEVFRLNALPTSYASFAGTATAIDPVRGVPGSFEDSIAPNTKYYYCARAIDMHGNRSNPTHIYEIEIVDNNGQIFINQSVFSYEHPKEQFTKSGRRFIYIEPTIAQTLLDPNADVGTAAVNNPPNPSILGTTDIQKVWGKEFKVRLTSKKTGRKVDLNLTFKNSGIVNASE